MILSPLEKLCGGRGSSEQIIWTDILKEQFEQAKLSVNSIETFHIPTPDDALHTFSDWSQSNGAVGGRLELHRTGEDGVIQK